jgi:hypothetical protein
MWFRRGGVLERWHLDAIAPLRDGPGAQIGALVIAECGTTFKADEGLEWSDEAPAESERCSACHGTFLRRWDGAGANSP